jgi:hypothetical protein
MALRRPLMTEARMKKGQRIRFRASDRAARDWGVSVGAEGVVMCRYELLAAGLAARECVDVKFGADTIVWGAPVAAFEIIAEGGAQGRGA